MRLSQLFCLKVNSTAPLISTLEHTEQGRGLQNCSSTNPMKSPASQSSPWLGDFRVLVVWSLSHVRLFVTLWRASRQGSLSLTNSGNLLKLMPIDSVMPSNHLILCCSFSLVRLAIIKKFNTGEYWGGSGEKEILLHC